MKLKLLITLVAVAAISMLFTVAKVYAQQPGPIPSDDDVLKIAKKLYCPVCPNTPLDVCETKACEDWRAQIKDQLSAGWSQEQILDYFVSQYGERVLAEPQRKGFASLVWVLPVIAALLGILIVWQVLKSWRSGHNKPNSASQVRQDVSPDILARIEKELREME